MSNKKLLNKKAFEMSFKFIITLVLAIALLAVIAWWIMTQASPGISAEIGGLTEIFAK